MNKRRLGILFIFVTVFCQFSFSQVIPCDSSLWQHVYHSYRLTVIRECKTVTGVVQSRRNEKDGDYHIRLRLDEGQGNLLSEKNVSEQDSCLVVEIICAHKVTQTDAVTPCEGYINNIQVPEVGQHISVTGSYVLDSYHGGWFEIHPVTQITVIQ